MWYESEFISKGHLHKEFFNKYRLWQLMQEIISNPHKNTRIQLLLNLPHKIPKNPNINITSPNKECILQQELNNFLNTISIK